MNLMKYQPPTAPLHEVIDRWFENMALPPLGANGGSEGWRPAFDIHEDDKNVTLKIDAPEMGAKDFSIEVSEGVLTVSGERKPVEGLKEEGFARRQRPYGPLQCAIALPKSADTDKVTAKYDKGVLTVVVPNKAEAKPAARRIPVS